MPPRASWTGTLKLSLVSIPVRLYRAVSESARIGLRMLHQGCHQPLHYQTVCAKHGEVEKENIVKGYEYEKGKFVVIDEETLDRIRLDTTKTINIVQFIDQGELDPILLDTPYYLAPNGPVATEAFLVLRNAMRLAGKIGIGQVVLSGREHLVAVAPLQKGLCMNTLHYPSEVHASEPYFEEITEEKIDQEELSLAHDLIEKKSGPLDLDQYKDHYEEALIEVIKAKVQGEEIEIVQEEEVGKVIDFMDALKRSLAQEGKSKEKLRKKRSSPAKSIQGKGKQENKEKSG